MSLSSSSNFHCVGESGPRWNPSQLGTDVENSLATVNFFLGCVGLTQVTRIMAYRATQKGSATEAVKDEAASAKDAAVGAAKKVEEKVKSSL